MSSVLEYAKFTPVMREAASRIIVALDGDASHNPMTYIGKLLPFGISRYKIGSELFSEAGPQAIQTVRSAEGEGFVDTKLNDIPTTVKQAAAALAGHNGVFAVNMHASAEVDAMLDAKAVVAGKAKLWVVTVLTSMTEEQCHLTFGAPVRAKVLYFARMAKLAGADGVICSAEHLPMLTERRELKGLEWTTPGIRSSWAAKNDQNQIATPSRAMFNGATYLVLGRQLTVLQEGFASIEEQAVKTIQEMAEGIEERKRKD